MHTHTQTHTNTHTHAAHAASGAELDLDKVARRVDHGSAVAMPRSDADGLIRALGLRMAAVSTYLGCVALRGAASKMWPSFQGVHASPAHSTSDNNAPCLCIALCIAPHFIHLSCLLAPTIIIIIITTTHPQPNRRLLDVRLAELEGPEAATLSGEVVPSGTGPLEADLALLDGHQRAVEAAAARAQQARRNGGSSSGGSSEQGSGAQQQLPYHTWCAVAYRSTQKRIVRAHAAGAREDLQAVVRLLRALGEAQQQQQQAGGGGGAA